MMPGTSYGCLLCIIKKISKLQIHKNVGRECTENFSLLYAQTQETENEILKPLKDIAKEVF